jgi:xanthine dehydrogenase YagT iron-sulfur-binding subunit
MDLRPWPAPPFVLHTVAGRTLTLAEFDGQPLVLAFFDGEGRAHDADADAGAGARRASPEELERARTELRGLGAALLVISREGLWCFRPDDEEQILAENDALDADELTALRARYGAPTSGGVTLYVLAGDLTIRFAHLIRAADASFAAVVDALAAAGRAMIERPASSLLLMNRRQLVVGSLVAAFSLAFLDGCASSAVTARPAAAPPAAATAGQGEVDITLEINGARRALRVEPRVTLLDALRERLGLTGTKKGCDQGQCGACTVLVAGRRVNACLTLAIMAEGSPITTIEGLARGEALHPLQAAFIAEDGFQCGYCTPGQIMSAAGMLAESRAHGVSLAGDDDVREQMSGNLCRCGAYPNIVAAIQRARKEM